MQRPEQLLTVLIAEAASFWEGRSADPRPFNAIMQGHEPLATLAKASGYHPHEITDGFIRWLECHPAHDE
jgi:hypothetical protein